MRFLPFVRINKKLLFIPVIMLFCFAVSAEDIRWAKDSVKVRTGPGTTYDEMGFLFANEKVEVFSVVNSWAQILFENVEGYVGDTWLLSEPITSEEESEAARKAAEIERELEEKARSKSRRLHILIIAIGIVGLIVIFKFF